MSEDNEKADSNVVEFRRYKPIDDGEGIVFSINYGTEVLRLANNGNIYVRGKLVQNDLQVVVALRNFLIESGHL